MTDLDDTLIAVGKPRASDAALTAIHELLAAGMHFGPVTGRIPSAMGWMFNGDARAYATGAFSNGQIIRVDGEIVHQVLIDSAILNEIKEELDRLDCQAWLCVFDPDDIDRARLVTAYPERLTADLTDVHGKGLKRIVSELEEGTGYTKANLQCACSRERIVELRDYLRQCFPSLSFVLPSQTAKIIDINDGGWGKGQSVRYIADYLGIGLDEIAVFGDAENDLSMIEAIPNSVAMANAAPVVQEAARWHIGSAAEDACAGALSMIARASKQGLMPEFMRKRE